MRVGFPVGLRPTTGVSARAFLTGFLLRKRLSLRLPCANAEDACTGPRAPRPNSAYRGPRLESKIKALKINKNRFKGQILQKRARPSRLIRARYAEILYDTRQLTSVVNL